MRDMAVGFSAKNDTVPPRGARIAAWVRAHMERHGLSIGELAFKVQADKRDLRRLLNDNSCGPRLNDLLDETFGFEFIDAVAAPLVGGDRIASLEKEIANEKAIVSAREAQLARLKAASRARVTQSGGALRLVGEEDRMGAA